MPTHPPRPARPADDARARAAALFVAAARTGRDIDAAARLRCLAAGQALTRALPAGTPPLPLHARDGRDTADPAELIRSALRVLGALPLSAFAATDIRAATVQGRRALRELPR